MKKTKLRLSRQTIRKLSDAQAAEAVGGCTGCTGYCTNSKAIDCPTPLPIPPAPPSFAPPYACWP